VRDIFLHVHLKSCFLYYINTYCSFSDEFLANQDLLLMVITGKKGQERKSKMGKELIHLSPENHCLVSIN
jgi:hypothetical protein